MAVIWAYCDESGTHAESPWITMSGWVADQAQWKNLTRRWRRVLKMYGVKEAHAGDMEARQGEFVGWDDEKLKRFRVALCRLVDQYVRYGVSVSVARADYERVVTPRLPKLDEHPFGSFHDPYVWLMATTVGLVLESEHRKDDERVAFVFDEGHEGQGHAENFFYWTLAADPTVKRRVVRKFMKECSLEFPPLQAADQLVWGCNRGTRLEFPPARDFVEIHGVLGIKTPVLGGHLTADGLEQTITNLGAAGPSWKKRQRRRDIEHHIKP